MRWRLHNRATIRDAQAAVLLIFIVVGLIAVTELSSGRTGAQVTGCPQEQNIPRVPYQGRKITCGNGRKNSLVSGRSPHALCRCRWAVRRPRFVGAFSTGGAEQWRHLQTVKLISPSGARL
jgi:hypothetical protein